MKDEKRCTAIVLAAGSGSRMQSNVAKQYIMLSGRPVIWYSLSAVERSGIIDDCILVTAAEDVEYARREIVEKYGLSKVVAVTAGGEERYDSVMNALRVVKEGGLPVANHNGYVFIHDGARPFLTEKMLSRLADAVCEHHACVAAMPAKDTVKITDSEGFALQTPDRKSVWNVQTPQVFDTQLIIEAYDKLSRRIDKLQEQGIAITDDAGVVELFTTYRVKMVRGSYGNIKLTTPEDMIVAKAFLREILKNDKKS